MQVKGTSIKTTRDFVKSKFASRYDEWVRSLPLETLKIYETAIKISGWYEINTAYYEPMRKIAELFYGNDAQKAGEDLGRYSAEVALTGIYKVFLLAATPQYLMNRTSRMMETFYSPSEVEVSEVLNRMVILRIKEFEGLPKVLEYRFAGWCVKSLELCNCKNISYNILSFISEGEPSTTIEFKWD